MKKLILSIFILCSFNVFAAEEAKEGLLKVSILSPIVIHRTKVAQGKIVSLSSVAIKAGYDEVALKGSVTYKRLPNKRTRVKINWINIKKSEGTRELTTPIQGGLLSQFVIDTKRLDAGEEISAKGDLDALSETLDKAIKSTADKKEKAEQEEEKLAEEKAAKKLSPPSAATVDTGTPDTGGYGEPEEGGSTVSDTGTALVITTYEACTPRIDKTQGIVYQQAQKVETLETGGEQSRGTCQDKGLNAPIVKTYDSCGVTADIVGGFVYKKYKEYAELNGATVSVTDCSTDFNYKFDVRTDTESCGVRHDFVNANSILMQQNYYVNDGSTRIDLGDCVDSPSVYNHYLTYNTCEAIIDEPNNLVYPQKRTAYNLENGTIQYASACAPIETETQPLQVETCAQKYEHDFAAGQSYKRNQSFYNDGQTNEKILIGGCVRDTTISFAHLHDTAGCGTGYDDANLQNIWKANTYIDLSSEGEQDIELAPCADYGNPTPYLYWAEGFKKVSQVTSSVNLVFSSRYNAATDSPENWCTVDKSKWLDGTATNQSYFSLATSAGCNTWGNPWDGIVVTALRVTWQNYKRYKRGDNSYYDLATGAAHTNAGSTKKGTTSVLP